jgi:dTDP-D-glucose 4,6-dehydratase
MARLKTRLYQRLRTEGFLWILCEMAGFIGSNTVDELVRRSHDVVVLDDLSSGKNPEPDRCESKH